MFQVLQDFQGLTFSFEICRVAAKPKLLPNNFDGWFLIESIKAEPEFEIRKRK